MTTKRRMHGLCVIVMCLLLWLSATPARGQDAQAHASAVEGAPGPARTIRLPASAVRRLISFGGEGRYAIALLEKLRQVVIVDLVEEKITQYIAADPSQVSIAADRAHLYLYENSSKMMRKYELATGRQVAEAKLDFGGPVSRLAAGGHSDGPVYVAAEKHVHAVDTATLTERKIQDLAAIGPAYMEQDFTVFSTSPDGSGLALSGSTWNAGNKRQSAHPRFFQIRNNSVSSKVELDRERFIYPIQGGDLFTTNRLKDFTGKAEGRHWEANVFPLEGLNLGVVLQRPSHQSDPALLIELLSSRPLLQMGDLTQQVSLTSHTGVSGPPVQLTYAAPAGALAFLDSEAQSIVLYPCDFEAKMRSLDLDFLYIASLPVTRGRPGQPYRYKLDVRSNRGGATYRLGEAPREMVVLPDGVVSWDIPAGTELPVRVEVIVQDASGQETFQSYRIFGE